MTIYAIKLTHPMLLDLYVPPINPQNRRFDSPPPPPGLRVQISLELFLAQYHIFLARDTSAVLVFLPGFPVLNSLLTTSAFVYVSAGLSEAFNGLMPLLIPAEPASPRSAVAAPLSA